MRKINVLIYGLLLLLTFCSKPERVPNEVRVRLAGDPETLNPVSWNNTGALQIINLLFQSLLTVDLADDTLKPTLVEALPTVEQHDSLTYFIYEVRPNAAWANGRPVTGADVAFTLKVLKAPLLNNERVKPQVEFIKDIALDPNNNKKFTLVCEGYSPEMELLTGDFFILPEYLFDPKGLLASFKLSDFSGDLSELENNKNLQAYAADFNSAAYARSEKILQGSGGYLLQSWVPGQRIKLKRKESWWGNSLQNSALTANPKQISFEVIPDNTTALLALRNEQLDVLENISAAEFSQLKTDSSFLKNYALFSPDSYEFAYVGLNSRLPKLADKQTRQAIANLLDVRSYIQVSQQSYATPTVGPIPPSITRYYNSGLKPYTLNLQKATALLQAAGWHKNQDRWHKAINGKDVELELEVSYRAGNNAFENAALIFQQSAARVGIPVTIQAQEPSLFSQNAKAHTFEMFFRTLSGNPFVFNFKPLLHTSFAEEGPNYTGFGTDESDRLLEKFSTASEQEKAQILKRLQAIMQEEATFISLYYQQDRLAVHKRFGNLKISGLSPNYDVSAFTLQK